MPESPAETLKEVLLRPLMRDPKGSGRTNVPAAWASTRGSVRAENQDRLLVARSATGLAIAVLADGMGGMQDGARAAAVAAAAVGAHCMAFPAVPLDRLLDEALRYANEEVYRQWHGEGGCTLVIAAWTHSARYVAHVGDSRAYLFSSENRLVQLTVDDTVRAQLMQLGRPPEDDARLHAQLLQFIGVGPTLQPHVAAVSASGRGIILTTDGAHSVPGDVMEWILQTATHPVLAADRLVVASEWHGGKDNSSVIAVSFQQDASTTLVTSLTEFWLPGEHIVMHMKSVPAGEVTRVQDSDGRYIETSSDLAPRVGKRGAGRQRPKAKGRRAAKSDHQVQIISLEESTTSDGPTIMGDKEGE